MELKEKLEMYRNALWNLQSQLIMFNNIVFAAEEKWRSAPERFYYDECSLQILQLAVEKLHINIIECMGKLPTIIRGHEGLLKKKISGVCKHIDQDLAKVLQPYRNKIWGKLGLGNISKNGGVTQEAMTQLIERWTQKRDKNAYARNDLSHPFGDLFKGKQARYSIMDLLGHSTEILQKTFEMMNNLHNLACGTTSCPIHESFEIERFVNTLVYY